MAHGEVGGRSPPAGSGGGRGQGWTLHSGLQPHPVGSAGPAPCLLCPRLHSSSLLTFIFHPGPWCFPSPEGAGLDAPLALH